MTRRPEDYDGSGTARFGDVHDANTLPEALADCDAAYYLVHSLDRSDFERLDREAAEAFAHAASSAGVQQIVYLGGLGDDDDELSAHLRSRREVERRLASTGIPVTVLRAGIVVGHGGISWEMTRELVKNLPAMIAPRWVNTRTQPIALADVISYLVGVLGNPEAEGRVFEIGGPEVLRYRTMIERLAKIEGKRVPVVPVPFLSPGVSGWWLGLVTSVDAQTGRSLVDSMTNEVVVRDDAITSIIDLQPMTYDEAVRTALAERAAERDPAEGSAS